MFVAGLIGGLSHCSMMCGPFSLSLATRNYEKIGAGKLNEFNRARASIVLPYHLGRITTYSALGAVSGYMASLASNQEWFGALRVVMIVLASFFFIFTALNSSFVKKFMPTTLTSNFISRISKPLFGRSDIYSTYGLGVMLGFIPCGLVYGALIAAAATASPVTGALSVAAFGFGTIIPLFATTYGAGFFLKRFRNHFKKIAPVMMGINSVLIFLMIFKLY